MPARPDPATYQPHRPATAIPARPHPVVPRQRPAPAHEAIPPQWYDLPPAGLTAPMPVPAGNHLIRGILIGIIGLLVLCLALGGFVLSTGSGDTIGTWRDDGGLVRLTALATDLSAAEDAARAADLAGMDSACRSLGSDTAAAQAYAPIPDAEAQTHWAAALEHLARASANCVIAVHNRDAALFIQASDEMNAVPADLSRIVDRLTALNQ